MPASKPEWLSVLRGMDPATPAAWVSILATEGSAPRGAGARMIVTASQVWDTIGGGNLEHRAIDQARRSLARPPGAWAVQDYPLGPLLSQCCGGRVRLLVEHLDLADRAWLEQAEEGRMLVSRFDEARISRRVEDHIEPSAPDARGPWPTSGAVLVERIGAERRPLLMFGAGHVGRAIAAAAAPLPFRLAWFDTRPETAAVPGVVRIEPEDICACAAQAPADAAILILTHDHALDYQLVQAALTGQAAFIGLIGSRTKRARFLSRLEKGGFDEAARRRITCPIGLPGIDGKEPPIIAIAVLAQLLALRGANAP